MTVGIEYGESLPRVEIVIRYNLETIKEHMHFVLPAVTTLVIAEAMRRMNFIKPGEMKLDL